MKTSRPVALLALLVLSTLMGCPDAQDPDQTPLSDQGTIADERDMDVEEMRIRDLKDIKDEDLKPEADATSDLKVVPDGGDDDMVIDPNALTYHEHVKPILNEVCTRCHYDGGQGGLDFTEMETVLTLGELILSQVEAGLMPPPVADPSCRDYQNSEVLSLSPTQTATLRGWVEGGKQVGQDDGVPASRPERATLEEADLVITLQEPYEPLYEDQANPNNEYRCFALEHGRDQDFYITAMHPDVDKTEIAHHIVLAKMPRSAAPPEARTPQGQDCITDMRAISQIIGAWAPGMEPLVFEKGGLKIGADEVLIIQMHYYSDSASTRGLQDRSSYKFKTADRVRNEILMYPFGTQSFVIPADEEDYGVEASSTLPAPDLHLGRVPPYAHLRAILLDGLWPLRGRLPARRAPL